MGSEEDDVPSNTRTNEIPKKDNEPIGKPSEANDNAKLPIMFQESPSSGHFMAYCVTTIVLVTVGYVLYHNRKKVNIISNILGKELYVRKIQLFRSRTNIPQQRDANCRAENFPPLAHFRLF